MPAESTNDAAVLIAGVGYHNLRDLSLGPVLVDRIRNDSWPRGVFIEDLSFGPVFVMHHLDESPRYGRMVFVSGVKRGREPGEVYCYPWNRELPDPEEIQARVAEAITGVISLDNLLIIATYFGKLPEEVVVIEVEAVDEGWGEGFTPPVERAIPKVIEEIRKQMRMRA